MNKDGLTALLIVNNGKSPCQLKSGMELEKAYEIDEELSDTNQTQTMSCTELAGVSSLSKYHDTSEQRLSNLGCVL